MYGWIPLLASCTYAQIGALNAESFCERVLSCANLVLTEGNTLLDDAEIEMLVILRMNRDFMEFMRTELPGRRAQACRPALRLHPDPGQADQGRAQAQHLLARPQRSRACHRSAFRPTRFRRLHVPPPRAGEPFVNSSHVCLFVFVFVCGWTRA